MPSLWHGCIATQESDIVVGSVMAGRRRVEIEDVIGDFVNTVALAV
jgi:non-ribosomal peptide synthetase component F